MDLFKLDEHFNCAVCLCLYTDPRRLPCNHVFCLKCLEGVCGRSNNFLCPECRHLVNIRYRELNSFPRDLKLASIVSDLKSGANNVKCADHGKLADIYCQNCTKLVCNACSFGGKHTNHHLLEMNKAAPIEQAKISRDKEDILNSTQTLEEAKSAVTRVKDESKSRAEDLLKKLNFAFGKMRNTLKEKERELSEKIQIEISSCEKTNKNALKHLQELLDSFCDCLRQIEGCTDNYRLLQNSADITKKHMAISSKYKSTKVHITSIETASDWKVLFDTLETVIKAVQPLREIPVHIKNDSVYAAVKVFQCGTDINEYIIVFLKQKQTQRERINRLATEFRCTILWEESTHSIYFKSFYESFAKVFHRRISSEISKFGVKQIRRILVRRSICHLKQQLAKHHNLHILVQDTNIILVGLHANVEQLFKEISAEYEPCIKDKLHISMMSDLLEANADEDIHATKL